MTNGGRMTTRPPPFRPERRAWRDSNPRPSDSKSAALSAELQARAYYVTDYSAEQSEGQDQPRVGSVSSPQEIRCTSASARSSVVCHVPGGAVTRSAARRTRS
jgi:hypothetical protein